MEYNEFLKVYSVEFLAEMDKDVHQKMLNKYFSIFGKNENLVIFDIGSNAGSFIESCINEFNNCKIYAFEPQPFLFKYLNDKYVDNGNISIYDYCVINKDGVCDINIPSLSVAISSVIDRNIFNNLKDQKIHKLEKKSTRIDTFCSDNNIVRINYMKIDVEGAEYMVLDGCLSLIKEGRIDSGQFEVGIEESGYSTDDIINLLESNGYIVDKLLKNDYFFYRKKNKK